MQVPYYRYKVTREATPFPLWSTTWPGENGCPSRQVYFASPNTPTQPPSPGSPIYYEPESVVRVGGPDRVSGRTNSNPPYHFTYRNIGKIVTKRHLVIIAHLGCNGKQEWYQYGHVPKVGQTCTPTPTNAIKQGLNYATFDELAHDFSAYDTYETNVLNQYAVSTALREVRNEVMEEALSSYDLLTDIAQIQDIPRSLSQISNDLMKIIRSLKSRHTKDVLRAARHLTPRSLLRHAKKAMRSLGDEWMNYRYGIMPLVYSYRDLLNTLDRGQEITSRKLRTILPEDSGAVLPPATSTYVRKRVEGGIVVRACVFQHFSSAEVARLSGVGINPFVTAWELIPYSFVFDWFLDVGNYIATRTGSTWASKRHACLSIRSDYTNIWEVHLPQNDKSYTMTNILPNNWVGAAPPAEPNVIIKNNEGYYLFKEEHVDTYRRMIIPTTSAPPSFAPSLNWRRYVDASVMSLNQLGRIFRSIFR